MAENRKEPRNYMGLGLLLVFLVGAGWKGNAVLKARKMG
jgi:hypothetical protein